MSEPYWVPLGAAGGVLDPAGIGTSLPASPVDGQEFVLVDSLTAPTYQWRFRYLAAKATNKWLFVGGAPIYADVAAAGTTTGTTYVALSVPGPSIVIPVAGDYFVEIGCEHQISTAGVCYMSYDIGATPAVDADAQYGHLDAAPRQLDRAGMRRKSLPAVTLTAKYKASTATGTFLNRYMKATPIAVGG